MRRWREADLLGDIFTVADIAAIREQFGFVESSPTFTS